MTKSKEPEQPPVSASDKTTTPKKPTPEQRAKLRKGGDYTFNPTTGALVQTRKPTQPSTEAK
ncbi:MAG: hypothetical protein M0P11_06905 [Anaerolineaceae bacterium]|nr:hypothetical protein [Anaerolineaceae bacterium]